MNGLIVYFAVIMIVVAGAVLWMETKGLKNL
jgi:hypothetical protein